ncbi:MAG: histidinol-phosphate transaminase [Steroidobacteraceae bacterium]
MSWISELARPEIVALKPYEYASWDAGLQRMHANEYPTRVEGDPSATGLNRYPEPQPTQLVRLLAHFYGVRTEQLLVGRGSDEAIDLLTRVFCCAGEDSILICPPTFGMYAVCARTQGAQVVTVPLVRERGYALDVDAVLAAVSERVRLVFLCSPNNPTGNLLARDDVLRLATALAGRALVVVDEAYVEFAPGGSLVAELDRMPQLAILRTLSKAHGLAGARCGSLLADPEVIALTRKIISPYAISQLTVEAVCPLLTRESQLVLKQRVAALLRERARLAAGIAARAGVRKVWPSDSNYLLVEFDDPKAALLRVREAGLIIRDVGAQPTLAQALRISVGTPAQNDTLIRSLQ